MKPALQWQLLFFSEPLRSRTQGTSLSECMVPCDDIFDQQPCPIFRSSCWGPHSMYEWWQSLMRKGGTGAAVPDSYHGRDGPGLTALDYLRQR